MIRKKIVVPEGMYEAALKHQDSGIQCSAALEAALRWLSDNPIVPTREQAQEIHLATYSSFHSEDITTEIKINMAVEWQRRMFLAPEPEVDPVAAFSTIDLRWHNDPDPRAVGHNNAVLEAFRRGKESK